MTFHNKYWGNSLSCCWIFLNLLGKRDTQQCIKEGGSSEGNFRYTFLKRGLLEMVALCEARP